MNYNKTLALIPALLLAACGGDTQTINKPAPEVAVVYSYPADGQTSVSPKTGAVLRFSDSITESAADLQGKIQVTTNGNPVAFSIEKIDNAKSLALTFDTPLESATDYTISFSDTLIADGGRPVAVPNAQGAPGVQFRTRGSMSGIASITNQSDSFEIASQVPGPDSGFPAMNFSTFRLTMTQPIHPDWKSLGGSVTLLDSNGQPVSATVLVKGDRIALDPCVTQSPLMCGSKEDVLTSGEEYTLSIQNLASLTDPSPANRFSTEWTFVPKDTGPTVVLQQSAVDSGLGLGASQADATRSILNGEVINGVTLNSVLQGEAGPSQQTGDLFAELAYAPAFRSDEALPLRIAKGSILRSTSLDVLVGGIVPVLDANTGILQTTGDIKVTMMSDASGYLSPNAYTNDLSAPRHITLFMDVAMNTENAQPNAALSQTLMGLELRGIAIVKDGVLTIDAIATVEPGLLAQEYTNSTIAFHLQAATDVDSALDAETLRPMDSTAPSLVSWTPGGANALPSTRQSIQRPGDPVILFFDEPLAPESLDVGITLLKNGAALTDLDIQLDGTSVALNPDGGLEHGVDYQVQINGVTDLAGNVAALQPLNFQLDPIDNGSVNQRPPLALTTYPGYPCETNLQSLDLNTSIAGQCYSLNPGHNKGTQPTRDTLPVSTLPADRPITVVFSQSMDLDSITPSTFVVEKVSAASNGKPIESETTTVGGRLEKSSQRVRFFPNEAWEPGSFYRYTLKSEQDPNPGTCSQSPRTSVCGENGLALKTDILEGLNDGNNGADPLIIYFEGVEPQTTVFTALRNLPVRDTNSNFIVDCDSNYNPNCLEPFEASHQGSDQAGWDPAANSTKLSVVGGKASVRLFDTGFFGIPTGSSPALIGCEAGEGSDCPRSKFIYQTYALNTEVVGPGTYDPSPQSPNSGDEIEGMLVGLYPTMLTTSSISAFTKIFSLLQEETITNTQVLRMRYAKDDPSCTNNCARNSLIPGVITEDDDGQPVFITDAELLIDAPDMAIPLGGTHDLFGRPFTLELEGDVTFFDDGRMQIEQRNSNLIGQNDELLVTADALGLPGFGLATIRLPLQIPVNGTYLNFVSNPVKNSPLQQ